MKYNEPPRWFAFTRTLIGYIGYGLGGLLIVIVLIPSSLFMFIKPALGSRVLRAAFRLCNAFLTRVYLPSLGLYKIIEISGYDTSLKGRPVIYVANHRGRLDGPLLLGIIHDLGVIMKSKYARQPLYASFVRFFDFISVNPNSLASLADTVKKCTTLLQKRKSLLVFPEGTRAISGKLLPFRDFAFRIAISAGIPVVPVIIHSDLPFMAKIKGSHFPRRTFTYRIRFLKQMHRDGAETAADFAQRVRDVLAEQLAVLDCGTVWEK